MSWNSKGIFEELLEELLEVGRVVGRVAGRVVGRVVGRSGLANLKGIFVFNSTVDAEYRGNVCVVLCNLSNFSYVVEIGNWIGQFIVEKRNDIKLVEYNYLPDSDRSNNGFGSTLGF